MSVTFSAPGAPRHRVPCSLCDLAQQDGWANPNEFGGCCAPYCDGTDEESTAPEVNMANGNAADVLGLLGIPTADPIGEIGVEELAGLRRRIIRAMNTDRSHLLREPQELEPGHAGVVVVVRDDGVPRIERRGCRAYVGGVTDEQVVRRLRGLLTLVAWAQPRGLGIAWG